MPLGLSYGEVAFIILAGTAAFGPKDIPIVARTAGRLAGRAVGYLKSVRNTVGSFTDRAQISELHMELQQATAQLDAIRHELRSGISLLPAGPLTRQVLQHVSSGVPASQMDRAGRAEQSNRQGEGVAASPSLPQGVVLQQEDFPAPQSAPDSPTFPMSRFSSPHTADNTGSLVYKDLIAASRNRLSANSEYKHGDSTPSLRSEVQDAAALERSSPARSASAAVDTSLESERGSYAERLLPISAASAGLIPQRKGGNLSGSDILSDALVEEEVASHALRFMDRSLPAS